jgi:hypothetical protein
MGNTDLSKASLYTSVSFPSGLNFGDQCFANNPNLKSFYAPNSASLGASMFANSGINKIKIGSTTGDHAPIPYNNCLKDSYLISPDNVSGGQILVPSTNLETDPTAAG